MHELQDIVSCRAVHEWLNAELSLPPEEEFNEYVANSYDRKLDESVQYHTDDNELLGRATDDNEGYQVASLSLGAPGLYCWQPQAKDSSSAYYNQFKISRKAKGKKKTDRLQQMIRAGLRGARDLHFLVYNR